MLAAVRCRQRNTHAVRAGSCRCQSHLHPSKPSYTVRQGRNVSGRARQLSPTRRCQAMARTTATYGVARPLRGGSTRSSHRATCATAFNDTISFRRASCRARCASVHILPLSQTTMVTGGSDRGRHTGPLKQALRALDAASGASKSLQDQTDRRITGVRREYVAAAPDCILSALELTESACLV